MNETLIAILERKRSRCRELVALPVGVKLRLLEEMNRDLAALASQRPGPVANPVKFPKKLQIDATLP